jgi:hypothetical protein
MAMTIVTNSQARDVLYWYDLTRKEQAEFDYLDTEEKQFERQFVRYLGVVYDLHDTDGEVTNTSPKEFHNGWHHYVSDSFFSGILIRWVAPHYEQVIMGRYYS